MTRDRCIFADVGKTSFRIACCESGQTVGSAHEPAAAVLTGPAGAGELLVQLRRMLTALPGSSDADCVVFGLAGYLACRLSLGRFAEDLRTTFPDAEITLTSDLVLAHAGALDGESGAVLVAGTGAVALGVASDGASRVADGLGPGAGDLGGGAWIGRRGLVEAARTADRGGRSRLVDEAQSFFGVHSRELSVCLDRTLEDPRRLAEFAPLTLEASDAGDPAAAEIVERAIQHLTATVAESSAVLSLDERQVAVVGGLTEHDSFRAQLSASIGDRTDLAVVAPRGDAIYGAGVLAGLGQVPAAPAYEALSTVLQVARAG